MDLKNHRPGPRLRERAPSAAPRIWLAAALVVITIASYAPVRHHDFVNLDDAQYVTENPAVRAGLTWRGVAWAFTTGHAGNWHPLTWISHMIDVELFGLDAGAHHLTSVGLHLASAVLLFWWLAALTGASFRSFVVAAIFAVHPLHVESVAWVAERKDVLSTGLMLVALWAYVGYVRRPHWSRYLALCTVYGFALMAKPMVVTFPFVLLLLDVWPLRRAPDVRGVFRLVREKLPLMALALASSVVTLSVQRQAGAVQALDVFPFGLRLSNAVMAYAAYVGKSLWPAALAALYAYPASIPVWEVAAVLAVLVGVSVLAIRISARRPYVPVGWFWFVGMLVPVIGLVQVGSQPFADRYTYVPLIGLAIIVVWGAGEALGRWRHGRTVGVVAAVVALVACAAATRRQVAVWKDGVTLWQHAVSVTRDNYRAYTNLGQALTSAGRAYEALPHFETALRINPSFAAAHNYFGLALLSRGEVARAVEHHQQAVRLRPRFVEAHNNLGLALAADGRLEEALSAFSSAVEIDPGFAPAHTNRGTALAELGRLEDALREFREAERMQPGSVQAQLNLGAVLTNLNRPAEAIGHYEAALRIDPTEPAALHGWGNALAREGKLDEALAKYNEALRVFPRLVNNPDFRVDVAVVFVRKGAKLEAIQELEAALRLDPSHQAARQLLNELRR